MHPRGVIEREVLGRPRRLRASLGFPGAYALASGGHTFPELMGEIARLAPDPWSFDEKHLKAALSALCECAGDPITAAELEDAMLSDIPDIIRAIQAAMLAGGVIEESKAEGDGSKKKPKSGTTSRGKSGGR